MDVEVKLMGQNYDGDTDEAENPDRTLLSTLTTRALWRHWCKRKTAENAARAVESVFAVRTESDGLEELRIAQAD